MTQFVVVYDRSTGAADIREFHGPAASEQALAARFDAESTARPSQEVAVLAASSRAALMRTHSRYFKGVRGALDDLSLASA